MILILYSITPSDMNFQVILMLTSAVQWFWQTSLLQKSWSLWNILILSVLLRYWRWTLTDLKANLSKHDRESIKLNRLYINYHAPYAVRPVFIAPSIPKIYFFKGHVNTLLSKSCITLHNNVGESNLTHKIEECSLNKMQCK